MIKVFTLNKNNKIELSEKELKQLLDDAYWEGYREGNRTTYTYTSPSILSTPYTWTTTTTDGTITLNSTYGIDSTCISSSNVTGNI